MKARGGPLTPLADDWMDDAIMQMMSTESIQSTIQAAIPRTHSSKFDTVFRALLEDIWRSAADTKDRERCG